MKARFQRGRVGGVSPFFAFQDIITSAMAVLITVVMLLALDIGEPGRTSAGEAASPELKQRLGGLLDQLSDANSKLRMAQDAAAAAKLNPAMMKAEIETMRAEVAIIQAQHQVGEEDLAKTKRNDSAAIVRAELEKQKAAIAAAAEQIAQREQEAARSLAEMKRAEDALHAKENQLVAQQARKNEIWLIPDKSETTKEPVLIVVTDNSLTVQRFDHPDKVEINGIALELRFAQALTAFSKNDQYLVFYFKPSGVEHFKGLTGIAKDEGFEIGYDAVGEDTIINFAFPR